MNCLHWGYYLTIQPIMEELGSQKMKLFGSKPDFWVRTTFGDAHEHPPSAFGDGTLQMVGTTFKYDQAKGL